MPNRIPIFLSTRKNLFLNANINSKNNNNMMNLPSKELVNDKVKEVDNNLFPQSKDMHKIHIRFEIILNT